MAVIANVVKQSVGLEQKYLKANLKVDEKFKQLFSNILASFSQIASLRSQ